MKLSMSKTDWVDEKHMDTGILTDALGGEWKGYVVWIHGKNNEQGFPLKQGILTHIWWVRDFLVINKG